MDCAIIALPHYTCFVSGLLVIARAPLGKRDDMLAVPVAIGGAIDLVITIIALDSKLYCNLSLRIPLQGRVTKVNQATRPWSP
jgi:hypothetical protein